MDTVTVKAVPPDSDAQQSQANGSANDTEHKNGTANGVKRYRRAELEEEEERAKAALLVASSDDDDGYGLCLLQCIR